MHTIDTFSTNLENQCTNPCALIRTRREVLYMSDQDIDWPIRGTSIWWLLSKHSLLPVHIPLYHFDAGKSQAASQTNLSKSPMKATQISDQWHSGPILNFHQWYPRFWAYSAGMYVVFNTFSPELLPICPPNPESIFMKITFHSELLTEDLLRIQTYVLYVFPRLTS